MTRPPEGPEPHATIAHAVSKDLRASRRRVAAVILTAVAGIATLGLAGCGSDDGGNLPDGVVARVGDAPITQAQLDRIMQQSRAAAESQGQTFPSEGSAEFTDAERQALQQLVNLQVITYEARECGPPCRVTDAQVTKQLDDITQSQFQGKKSELNKFLKQRKITLAEARQQVRAGLQQEKIQAHVTRGVRFTAADARKYYQDNRAQFRVQPTRTASHILVKTKAEADRLYAEATPQNFAELAKQNSIDTGTKAQGGSLGQIQKGQLVPEFEKVAFALPEGKVSKPVKTQFGWHLILVNDITPGRTIPFSEARQQIVSQQLQAKRDETFQKWVDDTLADWEKRTVYASDDLAPQQTTSTAATTTP